MPGIPVAGVDHAVGQVVVHAAGMGLKSILHNMFLVLGIDSAGMACPGISMVGIYPLNRPLNIFAFVNGQNHAQLLAGQRIIHAGSGLLHHDELRSLGYSDPGQFCDHINGLCHNVTVQVMVGRPLREDRLLNLVMLLRLCQIAALRLQGLDHLIINTLKDHQRVVAGAPGSQVSGLAQHNLVGSVL